MLKFADISIRIQRFYNPRAQSLFLFWIELIRKFSYRSNKRDGSIVARIFDVDSAVRSISNDEIIVGRVKIISSIQGGYIKADILKFCLDAFHSLLNVPKSNKAVEPCDQTRNLVCVNGKRQIPTPSNLSLLPSAAMARRAAAGARGGTEFGAGLARVGGLEDLCAAGEVGLARFGAAGAVGQGFRAVHFV